MIFAHQLIFGCALARPPRQAGSGHCLGGDGPPSWHVAILLGGRRAGSVALIDDGLGQGRPMRRRQVQVPPPKSGFAGFRFPPEVIVVAVRWYLRYGLSYRDVEELLAERGVTVDHVTIYRWVQRFTPLLIDAARPRRHATGDGA